MSGTLFEKPGCEVVQISPPRQPFMRGAGRLIEDVLDMRLFQRFVKRYKAAMDPLHFMRPHAEPEQVHSPGKSGGICKTLR